MLKMCFFKKDKWFPFDYDRYTKSDTATRLGIKNHPPFEVLKCMHVLHKHIIFPVAWEYGKQHLKINSVYRCLQLNRALGSKDTSQHIKGQAVDFEIKGVNNYTFWDWCKRNLKYDQLILEFHNRSDPSSGWVHCSYVSEKKNRNMSFHIGG